MQSPPITTVVPPDAAPAIRLEEETGTEAGAGEDFVGQGEAEDGALEEKDVEAGPAVQQGGGNDDGQS